MKCPDCGGELKGRVREFTCPDCGKTWDASYNCKVCGSIPELNATCGAVSFYCRKCNSLRGTDNLDMTLTPGK